MTKKEFTEFINKVDGKVAGMAYLCNAFYVVHNNLNYFNYDLDERNSNLIVKDFMSVFKKYNHNETGMFGCIYIEENQVKRHIALELFYLHCLDEKLYKNY